MNVVAESTRRSSEELSPGDRFLIALVERVEKEGWSSPSDFLRHFGPRTLLTALAREPALRVSVLVATTRVNERLAARKTDASAAEDLALALDEGLTDAAKVLSLIPVEAQVRHLDAAALWAFSTEGQNWSDEQPDADARERAVSRLTFMLEAALGAGVLSLRDVADGIGLKRIAACLPQAGLRRVVEHALSQAREGYALTEENLLAAVPLPSLLRHVPIDSTWSDVMLSRVAEPLGLMPRTSEEEPSPRRVAPPPPPSRKGASQPAANESDAAFRASSQSDGQAGTEDAATDDITAVMLDESMENETTQFAMGIEPETDASVGGQPPDGPPPESSGANAGDEFSAQLEGVRSRLSAMGRLPADRPELTLPILLSIESMYAELQLSTDPSHGQAVIRDAFPNETHLRIALMALIRLLDPEQRTSDSALELADGESLISALLYEEQRLKDGAPSSPPSSFP